MLPVRGEKPGAGQRSIANPARGKRSEQHSCSEVMTVAVGFSAERFVIGEALVTHRPFRRIGWFARGGQHLIASQNRRSAMIAKPRLLFDQLLASAPRK
jgi:hypothetical protein